MMADSAEDGDSVVLLASPAATEALAARLSEIVRPGDVIALSGPLGAGKTAFARGFIQAAAKAAGQAIEDVPSPTYTLVQSYPLGTQTIHHIDLYRLESPDEAEELGLDEIFADGVSLIEWPERLAGFLPGSTLFLTLKPGAGPNERQASLTAPAGWQARLTPKVLHG